MTQIKKKQAIVAILQTRCGCQRELTIPEATPHLYIPLKQRTYIRVDPVEIQNLPSEQRHFEAVSRTYGPGAIYVVYEEV